MKCPSCGLSVAAHVLNCHVCGAPVGFPNVRAADDSKEQKALDLRLSDARVAAAARKSLDRLEDFGRAVESSSCILARSLGDLHSFLKSDNVIYATYHSQVRAGSRIPEDNDWDRGRNAAESTVHPNYHEQINYSALSLDGNGVLWWGEYSISLKDAHLVLRTSVFEENPFLFFERHRIDVGKSAPAGYRATWNRRQDLAMAKLSGNIHTNTTDKEFAPILLHQGASRGAADFVECHIYGGISRQSVEKVRGPRPKRGADLVIWKSIVRSLGELGVIVEEV